MTISVEQSGQNADVTITWQNGTTIKTTGSIDTSGSVTSGVFTDNLCKADTHEIPENSAQNTCRENFCQHRQNDGKI